MTWHGSGWTRKMKSLFAFSFYLAVSVAAQDVEFPNDPYLAYRPPFARSLPVQIMLTGVVLTLVAVLFIHLMFTAQYHWPLAPVNYVLQLSGVTTLLISLIATIHVVLSAAFSESEKWPYMLSYIAVNVPPLDLDTNTEGWSTAERATWLVMNASTSGLIQITHIQFLTLLFPSRLEGRLIFALLGPLAVVAAVMQLLPISSSSSVNNIASIVRNVCNATLSLLFTLSLFIWGLLVNREQAWRTDGGTAVFGCASLSLAVVSTALNFLYVHREEEVVWLPGLMWAVVLWQSFLGWWWWVGAGSGGGYSSGDDNIEEKRLREAKRQAKKKAASERRKETRIRAKKVWKGVASAFAQSSAVSTSAQPRDMSLELHSRTLGADLAPNSPSSFSNTSRDDEAPNRRHRRRRNQENQPSTADSSNPSHASTSTGSSSIGTSGSQATLTTLPHLLPGMIHRWYASLRHAHNVAARVQAAERVERMREMGRRRDDPETGDASVESWGWSWEGLGWRRRRRALSRRAIEKQKAVEEEEEEEDGQTKQSRTRWSTREDEGYEMRSPVISEEPEEYADAMYVSEEDDARRSLRRQQNRTSHDPEQRTENTSNVLPPPAAVIRPRSVWWWGPLRRWRLQDSTIY